jgi:hypothetical protein
VLQFLFPSPGNDFVLRPPVPAVEDQKEWVMVGTGS